MTQFDLAYKQDAQVKEKVKFITNTYQVLETDRTIRASTVSGTGAFTITLPPVKKMQGKILMIYMVARNGTDDITIQDFGNDGSFADLVLDLAAEYTLLYCDGYKYVEIASNHA